MNYRELDECLRAYSDNERACRQNAAKAPLAKGKLEIIDGKAVRSLTAEDMRYHGEGVGGMRLERQPRHFRCPAHVHDFIELAYVYSGSCPFIVDNTPLCLKQGQAILIDSRMPHSIEALNEGDILINIAIDKSVLTNTFFSSFSHASVIVDLLANTLSGHSYKGNYIVFRSQEDERLERYIKDLCCELLDPSPCAKDVSNILLRLIISELSNVDEAGNAEKHLVLGRRSIGPILHYIADNFQTVTLAEAARVFGMSPSTLSTRIKQNTGMTFTQLVQDKKLDTARALLREGNCSIDEVARHVGYENLSFFYRIFRRTYGCTPAEYRADPDHHALRENAWRGAML